MPRKSVSSMTSIERKEWMKTQFGFADIWTEARVKCSDGSIYKGHLDRNGNRTGFGTLRCPIMVYGAIDPADMSKLIHWLEYQGEWQDDEANGYGILRRYRGDGTIKVVYEGQWKNGEQVGM